MAARADRTERMTLHKLADPKAIKKLVGGRRPDKRLEKASLTLVRSDGLCTADWFERYSAKQRIEFLRGALLYPTEWETLLRFHIVKPGSDESRPIDVPTFRDAARLCPIQDWLGPYAETILSKHAMAFRRGQPMNQMVRRIARTITKRNLHFGAVIDIRDFYGSLSWDRLDGVIERLPADHDVRRLLRDLIRVRVQVRSGKAIPRRTGISQGLSVSPILANIFLNDFDRDVARAIARLGALAPRYCDDICLLAPSMKALEQAVAIVAHHIQQQGLTVKEGTGTPVDLRERPIAWLGLGIGGNGTVNVPESVIYKKATTYQAKLQQGLLSPLGLDDALTGLQKRYSTVLSDTKEADRIVKAIKGKLDLSSLPPQRKEIDTLRKITGMDAQRHRRRSSYAVGGLR